MVGADWQPDGQTRRRTLCASLIASRPSGRVVGVSPPDRRAAGGREAQAGGRADGQVGGPTDRWAGERVDGR